MALTDQLKQAVDNLEQAIKNREAAPSTPDSEVQTQIDRITALTNAL